MTSKLIDGKKVCLVSILRAGDGLLQGMLDLVPSARVGHVGLYRDPQTLVPVEYYLKLPDDIGARQVIGQCAHGHPFGARRVSRSAVGDLGFAFEFFEGQLELLDLERELLRGLAEGHAAKLRELVAEGVDQRIARRQSGFELGDPGVLVDAGRGWFRHAEHLAKVAPRCQ